MPASWPVLPSYDDWEPTCTTVHLWSQVVGKVRLACAPWINHSWGVALYVTPRGLTTSPIPHNGATFALDFDFVDHALRLETSTGTQRAFALTAQPVAAFYEQTMALLHDAGIDVSIHPRPVEMEDVIPFPDDTTHAAYDPDAIHRFWHALVHAQRVFTAFRAPFIGKVSPVHFFWGAFDLAVTRFSGRTAPTHPGGIPNCPDWVMEEAYSHELSSAGFWPGSGLGEAAFYSYAYPTPDGFADAPVTPDAAFYHEDLGEFILPYEAVRTAPDPDSTLIAFLRSTYAAAADTGDWNRAALERTAPPPPHAS
ncbi:DUF5996 family protein [Salisaeta longa]|uniref:DUF5996 family protein n=1 Tax=Salisaeta longa TaxID=503170 RepID=UPI001B7F9DB3|nr:DUF5996 family protein [Salisaeta longa]